MSMFQFCPRSVLQGNPLLKNLKSLLDLKQFRISLNPLDPLHLSDIKLFILGFVGLLH